MDSSSYLEPVCCFMSSSNCCFLIYIQVSQEAGQVVWHAHLFQNFAQFIVIHTVKGFGIVNKAEIDVFLELSCFFHDPADVGNLISGSSAFLKPAWTSGNLWFTYCWSLAWRILSITLLACEMSAIVQLCGTLSILWHCLSLGLEWKLTFFWSLAEEPEIKLPTSAGLWKKQESSRKTSISALLTRLKPLTV